MFCRSHTLIEVAQSSKFLRISTGLLRTAECVERAMSFKARFEHVQYRMAGGGHGQPPYSTGKPLSYWHTAQMFRRRRLIDVGGVRQG